MNWHQAMGIFLQQMNRFPRASGICSLSTSSQNSIKNYYGTHTVIVTLLAIIFISSSQLYGQLHSIVNFSSSEGRIPNVNW